ncbi:MAG: type II toxin-antitoxin system prevent-host-death family antitoxin [Luteimonas sp.]
MQPLSTLDSVRRLAGDDTPVRSASEVKSGWSGIVREVARHGEVIVTHHGRPQAVVVDVEAYADLVRRAQASDPLDLLAAEFDRRFATLDTPAGASRLRRAAAGGIVSPARRRKDGGLAGR